MVKTLSVDNYDSFTYNLYALPTAVNGTEPTVIRNDSVWDAIDFDLRKRVGRDVDNSAGADR